MTGGIRWFSVYDTGDCVYPLSPIAEGIRGGPRLKFVVFVEPVIDRCGKLLVSKDGSDGAGDADLP